MYMKANASNFPAGGIRLEQVYLFEASNNTNIDKVIVIVNMTIHIFTW